MNNVGISENNRKYVFYFLLILPFSVLCLRFLYLQVYQRQQYFQVSEQNRIREIAIEPPRGLILDRHGEVLVDNDPAYSLSAIPYELQRSDSSLRLLSKVLDMSRGEILQKLRAQKSGQFQLVKLKRQISFETLCWVEEHRLDLPGVIYQTEPRRCYPTPVRAPHVFGYLGEITPDELDQKRGDDYQPGDIVGKKGLEKIYENYLKGQRGFNYVEVDVLGREIRNLEEKGSRIPEPGKNLHLTLDADLQRVLEQEFTDKRGGGVVLDVRNGGILAMASKPDYNPELFTQVVTSEVWNSLINDPTKPLYDRMIQSVYPPGSTFKLVLVAAALETGKITPETSFFCPGYYRLGGRDFDCWKKGGHGRVNLIEAIEQSCNVYFYNVGLRVGMEDWAKFAKLFGFGSLTRVDLMAESPGLVPEPKYFDMKYGKNGWTRGGLMLNLAVGQGDLLVSPLQMAMLAMKIANEGVYYQPHLLRGVEDPSNGSFTWTPVDSGRIREIHPETYKIIKEGMFHVVQGERGTGRAARIQEAEAAGKTGTAQNPHGQDHAWFIGFAPFERPEIAYCIFVENGGKGGGVAAPIARSLLRTYFQKASPEKPPLAETSQNRIGG